MNSLDAKETWAAALGELEVIFSKANYSTWFRDTFILELTPEKITVGVPNAFAKEWLENKYHKDLEKVLKKIHPALNELTYKVALEAQGKSLPKLDNVTPPASIKEENVSQNKANNLKSHYTFESFIIGNSNRLAVATAQAVAKKPGDAYNPLFIYGGVGLGKTHLVQAIGNEIRKLHPKKKIVYVSCEKFANDYINSIQNKKINDFKKSYRDADVLMVDDIQFMSGKDGTQEEFFHTFNSLHQANRQIIITSDRVPKAIPQLADRLSSRFGWGMVADIQPPNLEMRQAILKTKMEEKNYLIPDEVLLYIAKHIESNIRELEGALNRVVSTAGITDAEITIELATQALEDIIQSHGKNLTTKKIFDTVTSFFKISGEDLLSTRRNQDLVRPRQIVMYLLRHEMNLSYPKIGRELNKKDHTTIIHGVEKIEKQISRDQSLQKELTIIKESLHNA